MKPISSPNTIPNHPRSSPFLPTSLHFPAKQTNKQTNKHPSY
ncbi:predicted protein [Botrytis cinerea T4]|uniref:Uncharacterized protein n=1 Tax=Botryotinia fuckeliana (strain T4) TaxID=999810 RepID=G2YLQ6_BOTF4|nr:predicted protein [Botrytis cinerea T4]